MDAVLVAVGVVVTRVSSERGMVDIEVGEDVCGVVLGFVESAGVEVGVRVEEVGDFGVVDGVATGVR